MPLTDPVPSSAFDVLERNIQDTDKFANQETGTFTNRVGKEIKPIPVIEAEANAAVISLGWHQVGLFADGFTYLLQNDIAKDAAGDWYRWNGALPKVVTAGTLPSSDANFVKIDYRSHADLTDRNPADGSAHNADDIKDTSNGGSVQDFIDETPEKLDILDSKVIKNDRINIISKLTQNVSNWFWGGSGIAVMGDSISHGAFALDIYRNGWVNILKRCFNAEFQSESYGFVNLNDTLGSGATLSQEIHVATRGAGFTYQSGTDADYSISGGGYVSTSLGSIFTVDVPSFQKTFGVWYRALSGGGSFDIEVNGVVVRTIDTSSGNGGYYLTKGLETTDNGFGVCNIRLITTSANPVYLIGMQYEPIANEICLNNFSNSGRRMVDLTQDIINKTVSGSKVFIMALGHNDAADCEVDPVYLADIQQRIDWIIDACETFGVPCIIPDFNWSRGESAKIRVELKRLSDSLKYAVYIPFPDLFKYDSSIATSSELINDFDLFYDASHPNVLGHKIIAETIAKVMGFSCCSKTEALNFNDFWNVIAIPAGDVKNNSGNPSSSFAYRKNGNSMLIRGNLKHTTSPFPAGVYVISNDIPEFNFTNSTLHPSKINTSTLEPVSYMETRVGSAGFRLYVKTGNTLANMNFDLSLPC